MTDGAYRPRLRAHVEVGADRLFDRLLDREVPLEGAIAALAGRLDGSSSWPALLDELVAAGHDADDLEGSMRGLLCLHLVEGAGDETIARLIDVLRAGRELPAVTIPGARFECQGSGACCTGYAFGPLSDADVARLDALDLAGAFPHLTGPYVETTERGRFLRRAGDRCVFLDGDRRCGIHGAFGAEAKPGFCRLYPLDSFATIDGLRIADRGTCARFATSARRGLPLVDDLVRIRPLIEAPAFHHPIAIVDGGPWDYGLFLRFTAAAAALVGRPGARAGDSLAAAGRLLDALVAAVRDCPIAPGQPDAAVDQVLELDPAGWYREPDHVAAVFGQRRLVSLLDELAPAMSDAIAAGQLQSTTRRLGELEALVEQIAERLVERQGSSEPVILPADVEEALRTSMRQQLFGRRALVSGNAGTGLVRIGLIQLFALAAARADAGDRPLVPGDLDRGHSLATRVLESGALDRLLLMHEPRWREVVEGLSVAVRVVAA